MTIADTTAAHTVDTAVDTGVDITVITGTEPTRELTIDLTTAGSTSRRRRYRVPAALLVVAVLLATGGLLVQELTSDPSTSSNRALVDASTTSQVVGQVSAALDKVLSYNYANPGPTQQAAKQLLTGDASGQYTTLFTALQAKAPGEQLTLTAKVIDAGVVSLHGDTAQLLVFLDQTSTRASDKATSASAAQIQITALRQGGTWRISELIPL